MSTFLFVILTLLLCLVCVCVIEGFCTFFGSGPKPEWMSRESIIPKSKGFIKKFTSIPLADGNINSQLNIRRNNKMILQKELPDELKDEIMNGLRKTFEENFRTSKRFYFVADEFMEELVKDERGRDYTHITLEPCYYCAVIALILSQGFDYTFPRRTPYYTITIDVSLPIMEGKVYDSAMRYWQLHCTHNTKETWRKHFHPNGCEQTIGNSLLVI